MVCPQTNAGNLQSIRVLICEIGVDPLLCLPQCCCEREIEVRLWRDTEMQRH